MSNLLWYSLPLIISVSFVYAATRHEEMRFILVHALRIGGGMFALLAAIFAVLFLISLQV